jgi:hypothetical protein
MYNTSVPTWQRTQCVSQHRDSPIYAMVTLRKVQGKSGWAQSTYGQVCIQENPVEVRTPTNWNPIGRSPIAPPHVIAQQYFSAFISLCFHSLKKKGKFGARFKNVIISISVYLLKIMYVWNCVTREYVKSESTLTVFVLLYTVSRF